MRLPQIGEIVSVRMRNYLVEEVVFPEKQGEDVLVKASCLEDDALGESLAVLWKREVDAKIIGSNVWECLLKRGFDPPKLFSSYYHILRWNCVTSTNPKLFQAPYRAGIDVKAYQLEPLRKALLMPRINLFIADDVGLGKTIEAGLILRELLIRQKVRRVVISCPPSVVRQWQEEMENRFGLIFVIIDKEFVAKKRQERGYGVNPWNTHTRFIISHALLRDEFYAGPLRDWLKPLKIGSLLILDEAHHVAPASGSRYAIDSKITKILRELAPQFEHKLFLSATPHNGHSNSFSALLEILDPQRFCRGVPIKSPKILDAVMVRRLKSDLRKLNTDFPERKIVKIDLKNLPEEAPELLLSKLLQQYRQLREAQLERANSSKKNASKLVLTSLQKRLLSSIEAFSRTLQVHRNSLRKQTQKELENFNPNQFVLLAESIGNDDERAELSEEEINIEEEAQMQTATEFFSSSETGSSEISNILEKMSQIANANKNLPDPKVKYLIHWIREHLCPNLGKPDAVWNERRVLIFTEYTDSKRYLWQQLRSAIAGSDQEEQRIDVFHGGIGEERREAIKAAFNTNPKEHPLRILIATDSAREGVNLQNYCSDLFHFDIPWNPSRMEQRNGRIDRKLQRADRVFCYYFVFPQRTEDRILEVLVEKTKTILQELGSLSPVIERNLSKILDEGIIHSQAKEQKLFIEEVDQKNKLSSEKTSLITEELESIRSSNLLSQVEELGKLLESSRDWLKLKETHFRQAISSSLELLKLQGLQEDKTNSNKVNQWLLPPLDLLSATDESWRKTMDMLRSPRKKDQKIWEWRNTSPVRPVVFQDPGSLDGKVIHLHLEHRFVQRLFGLFRSQGFIHHELNRICVCYSEDPVPKVVALARLSLYGKHATRLHDEIVAVAAEWFSRENNKRKLSPMKEGEKKELLQEVEEIFTNPQLWNVSTSVKENFQRTVEKDVAELRPHLEDRIQILTESLKKKLSERGTKEAKEMEEILHDQQKRISEQLKKTAEGSTYKQLTFGFNDIELSQIQAERRYQEERLHTIEKEIQEEPEQIRKHYEVKAQRIEPIGLLYLWPLSR